MTSAKSASTACAVVALLTAVATPLAGSPIVPTAGLVLSAALAAAAAALAHRQGAGLRRLGERAAALAGDAAGGGNDPQRDLAAALDRI
ncbi:hypothetical protein, partial [Azospirillum argentinense]